MNSHYMFSGPPMRVSPQMHRGHLLDDESYWDNVLMNLLENDDEEEELDPEDEDETR